MDLGAVALTRRAFVKTAAASLVSLYLPNMPTGEALALPGDGPKRLWLLDRTMLAARETGLAADGRPFRALDPPLIWDTRWDRHDLVGDTYIPAPNARLKPQYRDQLTTGNPTYLEFTNGLAGWEEGFSSYDLTALGDTSRRVIPVRI